MSHPRTLVPSPLARLLRAWARLDTNAAPADPAGRLGEWLSAVDSVRFSPSSSDFAGDAEGEFQIEIYGYTAATYQLSVQISPGVATASLAGGVDPDKSPLTQPLLNPDSVPASRQVLPTAPVSSAAQANALYLPAVSRLTNSYLYLPTISQ